MKYLLPTVAGCASVALVGTLAVTTTTAFAASTEPEVTQKALSVSEDGLNVPGARASSDSTANAANQSATSNLPNIFKSETAMASTQVPNTINVGVGASAAGGSTGSINPVSTGLSSAEDGSEAAASEDSTPKPDPSAPADESATKDDEASTDDKSKDSESSEDSKDDEGISGSVRQKTEDGVNIALISDVLDVPSKNPSLIGFTFSESKSNIRIQVRVKSGSDWGNWTSLDEEKQEQAKNKGSEPFTVSQASGVQMRILGDKAPSDAELVLVDPKHNPSDAAAVADNDPVEIEPQSSAPSEGAADTSEATPGSTSTAASTETVAASGQAKVTNQNYVPGSSSVNNVAKSNVPKPKIGSRKSWGAKSYNGSPDYASGIKKAVVHHTAGSNSYSAEDVPSILRGIQSYHQSGRGWDDIGYNVIADKYGRLWHARGGDIEKAVIGAHVAGHNTGTFGISVLGSYDKKAPPKKTRDAVASAIAWKLSMDGVKASKSTVVAHRDLANTSCPGDAFYSKMGEIRSTVSDIMKSGDLPSDEKKDDDKKDDKKEKPKPKTAIEQYAADHKKELGKATGKEHDLKGVDGARARAYEKGNVYWSKKTGAYHLSGAIKNSYKGDVVTQLGLPTANEKSGLKDGGAAQSFQKGKIYWSKDSGAHYTKGTLQNYWGDKGTVSGHLGYPESDPVYKDGRGEQLFEGARLVWAEGYGTTEFSPTGTISGGVVDDNAPGASDDANASGGADASAPPGDSPTDGGSAADSGEGSADDKDAKDDKKADEPKNDEPKADEPKDDDKSKDEKKDDDKSKSDEPKDDKKDEPSKAEKIQAQRDSIIKEAKSHLGVSYVWGGTSPTKGWDCSGYTQYVYGKNGIELPRTTSQQRNAGTVIPTEDAKPGDLIWIPGHIGIISENEGKMYDAGSSRTNTTERSYSWMLDRGAKVIRVVG
ncbi:LGFP repeat-containing protein [Brevibacterium sandarakinum]|uniref:LGFP repeat-containing protein n=1 Tax=Brevibacterium sandarakinum TaxID=629680 RepID=A0A1H1LJL5_BRESA|nr:NlpC/P60 family protein [Brevibacterium sandarakinum]SDR74771.1 LGFP repeat-containing protein [Brevibacterium sandarakinum]